MDASLKYPNVLVILKKKSVSKCSHKFFKNACPVVGDSDNLEICLVAKVDSTLTNIVLSHDFPISANHAEPHCWFLAKDVDGAIQLEVKVRCEAAKALLNVSVESLKNAWEAGRKDSNQRPQLLQNLNQNMHHSLKMTCTTTIRW